MGEKFCRRIFANKSEKTEAQFEAQLSTYIITSINWRNTKEIPLFVWSVTATVWRWRWLAICACLFHKSFEPVIVISKFEIGIQFMRVCLARILASFYENNNNNHKKALCFRHCLSFWCWCSQRTQQKNRFGVYYSIFNQRPKVSFNDKCVEIKATIDSRNTPIRNSRQLDWNSHQNIEGKKIVGERASIHQAHPNRNRFSHGYYRRRFNKVAATVFFFFFVAVAWCVSIVCVANTSEFQGKKALRAIWLK